MLSEILMNFSLRSKIAVIRRESVRVTDGCLTMRRCVTRGVLAPILLMGVMSGQLFSGDFPESISRESQETEIPLVRLTQVFSGENPDVAEIALLTGKWADTDLAAAVDWAVTLSSGPLRDEVMAATLQVWGRRDPAVAAELLRTQIEDAAVLHDAIRSLALQWGGMDLKEVRRWTETLEGSQAEAARMGGTQAASASKYGGRNP